MKKNVGYNFRREYRYNGIFSVKVTLSAVVYAFYCLIYTYKQVNDTF